MGGVSLTALTFISTSSGGGGGGGGVREVEVTTEGQIEVESSKMDQTKGSCKSADFLLLHHQLKQSAGQEIFQMQGRHFLLFLSNIPFMLGFHWQRL